jgi:hypothetical protein
MEIGMRSQWNMGVAVAIALAVVAALSGERATGDGRVGAATPTHVTLSLQTDGVSLRVVRGQFAITVKI